MPCARVVLDYHCGRVGSGQVTEEQGKQSGKRQYLLLPHFVAVLFPYPIHP